MKRVLILISLLSIYYGCHKSIPTINRQSDEIMRYFPIKKGYSWSYLLTSLQDNTTSVLKTTIEDINNNEVKINSNGSIFYYVIKDDGIMKKAANYYILKQPIKKGSYWEFKTDDIEGKITIADIIPSKEVRGKEYKNCLITEEIVKGQNLLLRTYYAEDVGPIIIEQYLLASQPVPVLRAELLGYSFDESLRDQTE
ncbi:MAG: hypothetical protein N2746_00020 [Deltaproteobacteria bacterium]|nr:hypothetical protein [Deltaproteobacteria bacterium]